MAESIDLTRDGGVMKTIVRRAKPEAIAPSDNLPLVDGTLAETGEVFDTTHEDNTIFSFEIGKGSVIKAWDVALRTMNVGEVAKITCKSDYAYGSVHTPAGVHEFRIPPKAHFDALHDVLVDTSVHISLLKGGVHTTKTPRFWL